MRNNNNKVIMNDRTAKLVYILRTEGRTKMEDLSLRINCSLRTVRSHVKIAKTLGYNIQSYAGNKDPGYELVEEELSSQEWELIRNTDENLYKKLSRILIERI
jgi:DeoR/GlpR family transcriptional regulator of sugar metabolism